MQLLMGMVVLMGSMRKFVQLLSRRSDVCIVPLPSPKEQQAVLVEQGFLLISFTHPQLVQKPLNAEMWILS
jgi:hypothetical protein